ncbi:unnamed protein product, partial [Pelagomonas calceolata]
ETDELLTIQATPRAGTLERDGVVERQVAPVGERVEVRADLRREHEAFDDGERPQARPEVDVVQRHAALGRAVGAVDEGFEVLQLLVHLGDQLGVPRLVVVHGPALIHSELVRAPVGLLS